jgi:hypothetical protein
MVGNTRVPLVSTFCNLPKVAGFWSASSHLLTIFQPFSFGARPTKWSLTTLQPIFRSHYNRCAFGARHNDLGLALKPVQSIRLATWR